MGGKDSPTTVTEPFVTSASEVPSAEERQVRGMSSRVGWDEDDRDEDIEDDSEGKQRA